jgi:hypothetical protein
MLVYMLDGDKPVRLIQGEGEVLYPVQGGEEQAPCMWFALCENPALTTEHAPGCGDVPICERCHRRMFPEKYEKKEA